MARPLSSLLLLGLLAGLANNRIDFAATGRPAVTADDWRLPRYDQALTNRSPLKNTLREAPQTRWRLEVGGWSGTVEVMGGMGGRASTSVPLAKRLEASPPGPPTRLLDVAGTGRLVPLGRGYWAKLLPNVRGLQRVAWTSTWGDSPARIQCFSYQNGVDSPKLEWETELVDTVYSPQILLADVNGDGRVEVVSALHHRILIFDGGSGRKLHEIKYHNLRNYGFFGLFFEPGDPYAKFVNISDFANHFDVIDFDGNQLKVAWRRDVEGTEYGGIERHTKILRPGPNPLEDIDGDGHPDLTFNFFNDKGDERWHLVSYQPLSGKPILDLKGEYLVGLYDIDGCGSPELFCQSVGDRQTTGWSRLNVYKLRSGRLHKLYSTTRARFGTFDLRFLPSTADTGAAGGSATVAAGAIGPAGERGFVVLRPDATGRAARAETVIWKNGKAASSWSVHAPARGTVAVRSVAGRDAGSALQAGSRAAVKFMFNSPIEVGTLHIAGARARLQSWTPRTDFSPAPLVVSSGGRRYLVTETANDGIAAYELSAGHTPRLLWRHAGNGMGNSGSNEGLAAGDVDGDGRPEVVFATQDAATGAAALTVVTLAGRVLWMHAFPGFDSGRPVWNFGGLTLWTLGHLTDPHRLDVYVTARRSTMHSDISFALDGRTGARLWSGDNVPVNGKPTWGFGGQPVSTVDFDGNGLDGIVSEYPVVYYVVHGKTGKFARTLDLNEGVFDGWPAYGIPVVADFQNNGSRQVLVSSPWVYGLLTPEGKPLWSNSTGVVAPNAANVSGPEIGDFDGDGKLEILRLFTAESPKGQNGLEALDGATGQPKFAPMARDDLRLQATAIADIDGDGADELLARTAPNVLGALGVEARTWKRVWQVELGGEPMRTIVADIDGDGSGEIVVGSNDGCITAFGR